MFIRNYLIFWVIETRLRSRPYDTSALFFFRFVLFFRAIVIYHLPKITRQFADRMRHITFHLESGASVHWHVFVFTMDNWYVPFYNINNIGFAPSLVYYVECSESHNLFYGHRKYFPLIFFLGRYGGIYTKYFDGSRYLLKFFWNCV